MSSVAKTSDFVSCLENDIRMSNPSLAVAADYGKSQSAAIALLCLTCCGGDQTCGPDRCTIQLCPLWQYRPGAAGVKPAGIPSKALLEARKKKVSPEATAALRAYRTKPAQEQTQ